MNEVIIDAFVDTVRDTAILIPFLFITYLAMEWLEGRTEERSVALLSRKGKSGYVIGAGIGLIPQCGFSAAAASLFSGGVISAGTMVAVFLSTSDEMIPIFLSSAVSPVTIAKILAFKFVIAVLFGFALDKVVDALRRSGHKWIASSEEKQIHDLCEQDHCGCEDEEGSILRSALVHTLKITMFIFIISLALSLIVGIAGREAVSSVLIHTPVIGTVIAGAIGLIPNCAASVLIAELYLGGMITSGQLMAGLLSSAGVGLLVLTRTNKRPKENAFIISWLLLSGVIVGLLTDAIGLTF